MARFDTESLLKNALATVKSKINEEIAAINTEKADFALLEVKDAAYYFAQLPKGAFNYNPFIIYGFAGNPTLDAIQDDNSVKTIPIYFEVVLVDGGNKDDENIIYKLLRYGRALEDIFNKNSSLIMKGFGKLKVSSLEPTTLFSLDGKIVRSAGVSVTATITAR